MDTCTGRGYITITAPASALMTDATQRKQYLTSCSLQFSAIGIINPPISILIKHFRQELVQALHPNMVFLVQIITELTMASHTPTTHLVSMVIPPYMDTHTSTMGMHHTPDAQLGMARKNPGKTGMGMKRRRSRLLIKSR